MKAPREIGRALRDPRRLRRLPRAARAYLAGLGTAGSLVAGAALIFILASALVAFRGWPHIGAPPSPGEVVISARPASANGSPSARRLARIAAATAAVARAPGAGGATGLAGARGGGPGAPARRRSSGTRATPSRFLATAPTALGAPGPVPAVQQGVEQVRQGVRHLTGTLGSVVSGAGSQVGPAAQATTDAAAGAVRGVSAPAASVVQSAGSGTASAVGGVTQSAAGAVAGIGGP